MPLINLVYDRQALIRKNERKARSFFFASVGILVLSVALCGSFLLQVDSLARDQAQLNLRLSELKPLVAETVSNERLTAELTPRLTTLEGAQKTSDRWTHILAHLTHNTPKGLWLTALRGTGDDPKKPIGVTLAGKGEDQKTIADLIIRAQALPDLVNVNLKYSELAQGGESHAIDFEVDADIAGTDPAQDKPAGSGS
jgi:Tfp pilus assembly protein PilN